VRRPSGGVVAMLLLASLAISACGTSAATEPPQGPPARVEKVPGSDLTRVVLTKAAAERVGIRTARVQDTRTRGRNGRHVAVVPFAAVFYDSEGDAFIYTSPQPLAYVRRPVAIDDIVAGRRVFLRHGPPAGTAVVTVGAHELLGVEDGVQE
jgi:hypothetical protein